MLTSEVKARLDVRGLPCPGPLIKTKQALTALSPGERLEVLADDPAFSLDVAAFCDRTGNRLLEATKVDSVLRFVIEHK